MPGRARRARAHPGGRVRPGAYEESGVSIDAGNRTVRAIRSAVRSTFNANVLGDIGGFGGLFALPRRAFRDPVLVSSTDGVGTKLRVALLAGRFDTVGQDLVNHCANDVAVTGATPLFFLDYFASGRLQPDVVRAVVSGMARACRENKVALLGGETAEMPGFYAAGDFDIAGFMVGAAERGDLISGKGVRDGDLLLGWASTGLHTNGYSLARRVLLERGGLLPTTYLPELDGTLGDALLAVHRSYAPTIRSLRRAHDLLALAHLTGGGWIENVPRVLADGLGVRVWNGSWPIPPLFTLIQEWGAVPEEEMRRVFNLGIGMVVVVREKVAPAVERDSRKLGERCYRVGRVVRTRGAEPRVRFVESFH